MALLIISIILTIILFIGLGFRYIPGEGRFDDGKISWKFSKRNLLSFLALIIVAFGFFTKIPANSVGIIYSNTARMFTKGLSGFKRISRSW